MPLRGLPANERTLVANINPHSPLGGAIEPFPILQRLDSDLADGLEYLAADVANVSWGRLPTSIDKPVMRVEPGQEIVIDTISHEGLLEDQGRDPTAFFSAHGIAEADILRDAAAVAAVVAHEPRRDGPHVITGPIAVAGAHPGDLLAVRVLELTPRSFYGVISSRHGKGALAGEMPQGPNPVFAFCTAGHGPDGPVGVITTKNGPISFPLHLFLGIIGVATAATDHHSSIPPGHYGGNVDIRLLETGATLYLPVQVPDALVYVGDPHYAQGDGEVALTAFEAPLRARLRFDVISSGELAHSSRPYAETAEYLVPIGLDEDLDVAMRDCVRAALDLLQRRYKIDRATAYAYLSAAGDFAISQVVDIVQGVHGKIRKGDLVALERKPDG